MAVQLSNGDVTATGRVTGAKVKVANALDLEVGSSATLGSLLDAKLVRPTTDTSAEINKFLKKTATGTEWATVQSGPSIVTSFPAVPVHTDVPSTKLVKDSLDEKFDKAGGTISGDVEISADPQEGEEERGNGSLTIGANLNGDGTLNVSGDGTLNLGDFKGVLTLGNPTDTDSESEINVGGKLDPLSGENNGSLTIKHTGSANETLTQRIVRDANVGAQITADVTHAKGASAGGQTASTINANGVLDVSSLFSGDNTSLTYTIDSKISAKVQNLDPDTASLADLINALKGNN